MVILYDEHIETHVASILSLILRKYMANPISITEGSSDLRGSQGSISIVQFFVLAKSRYYVIITFKLLKI